MSASDDTSCRCMDEITFVAAAMTGKFANHMASLKETGDARAQRKADDAERFLSIAMGLVAATIIYTSDPEDHDAYVKLVVGHLQERLPDLITKARQLTATLESMTAVKQ